MSSDEPIEKVTKKRDRVEESPKESPKEIPKESPKEYVCSDCGRSFHRKQSLSLHFTSTHRKPSEPKRKRIRRHTGYTVFLRNRKGHKVKWTDMSDEERESFVKRASVLNKQDGSLRGAE